MKGSLKWYYFLRSGEVSCRSCHDRHDRHHPVHPPRHLGRRCHNNTEARQNGSHLLRLYYRHLYYDDDDD